MANIPGTKPAGSPMSSLPPLSRISLAMDSETADIITETERRIWAFSQLPDAGASLRAKAAFDSCLHIESIANMKLTGKQVSVHEVFREAAVKPNEKTRTGGEGKRESLRNIDALLAACTVGRSHITVESFYEIHRQLLTGTSRELYQGMLRTHAQQTGGGRYQSFDEPYRPPDPESIPRLLVDLALFCNKAVMPAIAQAALAHAQFLAIHPFERANGKTARALIQLVLQHRQLLDRRIPPFSLVLALSPHGYREGVIATMKNLHRETPDPDELNAWIRYFANCLSRAIEEAERLFLAVGTMQDNWQTRVGARSDSASTMLIDSLLGIPVFTVNSASAYLDRSFKRVTVAAEELMAAGVIKQITQGKRNRVFECPAVVDAYARIPGFQ